MNTKSEEKISMIIPVYNEAFTIRRLIEHLKQFKGYCEIIFVDGGSSDGTNKMIEGIYRIVDAPQKGRAHQMNYGASLANGDILLFLHADSFLPGDALSQIQSIMNRGYKVGCFKIRFDSSSILMKICGLMSNLRVRLRNIAFGDQGIFIEKSYFYELGGFAPIPLMEDYQLSMDIKTNGEKIALSTTKIETSERRFLKSGRIKTMVRMQRLQYMYRKGIDIEVIANLYR